MTSPDLFLHGLHEGDRAALAERWSGAPLQRKEMIIAHEEESRDVFFVFEGERSGDGLFGGRKGGRLSRHGTRAYSASSPP